MIRIQAFDLISTYFRMKSGIILALELLVSFAAIDKSTHLAPIVFEELGVILQSHGIVAMDTDDLLVTVFTKVQ